MPDGLPPFDVDRLIADLRKGDAEAEARAYRLVFDNAIGRQVLAHHLADSGVGQMFGAGLTDAELRYRAGFHDAAIALANKALFDQASILGEFLSEDLRGKTDDQSANHPDETDGYGGGYVPPDDDF